MQLEIGQRTDVGRRRKNNEDSLAVRQPQDPDELERRGVLCVVADGMGGHAAGEVASRLAVETIVSEYYDTVSEDPNADPADALLAAIRQANLEVFQAAQRNPATQGMGTTVACALFLGSRLITANIGDSPIFLIRDGQVHQVSRDHSWVAEQVQLGRLTPAQARRHPYRNVLTRALGLDEQVQPELFPAIPLRPGDVVVLCSDGLTEHVAPEEIARVVQKYPAQVAADTLVDLANDAGGSDNITVIVVKVS